MRAALGLVLIVLAAVLSAGAYETLIFVEDFSGDLSANWLPYGFPRPVIMSTVGNPAPSFKNNGDSMYRSGAVSKVTFDYTDVLIIEADYRVTGYNLNGCWVSAGIGLLRDYNYHDSLSPGLSVAFSQGWSGAMCQSGNREGVLSYSLITSAEDSESGKLTPMNDFIGDWHTFRIFIDSSNYVSFYVDNRLVFSSTAPLSSDYNNMPLVLAHNSVSAFGEALHDNIRVVQTKQVIWDLVSAFGIDFSVADALYNQVDEEDLLEALGSAQGNWDSFIQAVFSPQEILDMASSSVFAMGQTTSESEQMDMLEKLASLQEDLQELRRQMAGLEDCCREPSSPLRVAYVDAEDAFMVFVLAVGDLRQQIARKSEEINALRSDYAQGVVSRDEYERRLYQLNAELLDARVTTAAGTLDRMIASDNFSDLRTQLLGIRQEAQVLIDEVSNLVATIRVGAIGATEFQNRYNSLAALFEQFDQVVTAAASTKLMQAIEKVARAEGVDLVLQRKDVILYRKSTTIMDLTEEVKAEIRGYL